MGICLMGFYVLMIGISVSVCRAFVSFLLRVGADMTGRSYDGATALSLSALIVLLRSPLSIYDAGFWLSFGSVTALYLVQPVFRDLPFQGFWSGVSVQLVILPVLLVYYYAIPTYSIFLNFLVLPLMPMVLAGGFVGSLMALVSLPLGSIVLKGAALILKFYEKLCCIAVELPWAEIVTGKPKEWQILAYYGALVAALWIYRRWRKKGKKEKMLRLYLIPAAVFSAGILLLCVPVGRYGKLSVTMLDVGQGDCIFLRGPKGDTCLIDGGSSDVKNVGKYRIEPFLKSQGVKELDYVFVSHGDADHMNGIEEMLGRQTIGIRIKMLVLPVKEVWDETLMKLAESARKKKVEVAVAEPGQRVQKEAFFLMCMLPCEIREKNKGEDSGNEDSMVLKLSYGTFDMLFTGDLEGSGEEELKKMLEKSDEQFEALKTAHHGSKNSTSEEFLGVLRPKIALISAGQKNRYGHPHEETLERLKGVGSTIYCTKENGAVTVTVEEEGRFSVTTYLPDPLKIS